VSATAPLVTPAILTGTKPGMKVRDEEVFGPVVAIEPYDDFEQALADVNHSKYGLQAGLLTRDAGRILTAYRELEVGALIVGDTPSWRLDPMPFGGVKDSGLGSRGHSLGHRRDDRAAHAGNRGARLEHFSTSSVNRIMGAPSFVRLLHKGWESTDVHLNCKQLNRSRSRGWCANRLSGLIATICALADQRYFCCHLQHGFHIGGVWAVRSQR